MILYNLNTIKLIMILNFNKIIINIPTQIQIKLTNNLIFISHPWINKKIRSIKILFHILPLLRIQGRLVGTIFRKM